MNRADFQHLADLRIQEAKVLLDNGFYEGAYYLAGYAIECALKACIARQTKRYDFPDKQRVNASYTHNLAELVRVAGLQADLKSAQANQAFSSNWAVTEQWSEDARYRSKRSRTEASDIYLAITDPGNGVLAWLKKYW